MRLNPNGFFYMFRWWPQPLHYDGQVFGYSWLGFWWGERRLWRKMEAQVRKEKP